MSIFKIMGILAASGAALAVAPVADARPVRAGEVTAVAGTFRALDRNRDGRVGRFEYRRHASAQFAHWMSRVDRDRDGFLTGRERARARRTSPVSWRARWSRSNSVPLWRLWSRHIEQASIDFTRIDRNRDGFLSRREVRRARLARAELSTPRRVAPARRR